MDFADNLSNGQNNDYDTKYCKGKDINNVLEQGSLDDSLNFVLSGFDK